MTTGDDLLDAVAMFTDLAVDTQHAEQIAAYRVLNRWEEGSNGWPVPQDVLRSWALSARGKGLDVMAGIFERHMVMYRCAEEIGLYSKG